LDIKKILKEEGNTVSDAVWRKCTQLLQCNSDIWTKRADAFKANLEKILVETRDKEMKHLLNRIYSLISFSKKEEEKFSRI
jgi:hypothetical protein